MFDIVDKNSSLATLIRNRRQARSSASPFGHTGCPGQRCPAGPLHMGLPTECQDRWRVGKPAMGSSGSGFRMMTSRVVAGAGLEHGAEDAQERVWDDAQGAAVGFPTRAQSGIALVPVVVDLGGDASPVKDGNAQVGIAGQAALDDGEVAALAGDGSDAGEGAQRVVVVSGDGVGGLGEQGGEEAIAGGGGRVDDGDVVE